MSDDTSSHVRVSHLYDELLLLAATLPWGLSGRVIVRGDCPGDECPTFKIFCMFSLFFIITFFALYACEVNTKSIHVSYLAVTQK